MRNVLWFLIVTSTLGACATGGGNRSQTKAAGTHRGAQQSANHNAPAVSYAQVTLGQAHAATAPTAVSTPYWQLVNTTKKLVVGISHKAPPFAMHTSPKTVIGLDVELAQLLARTLGVELTFVELAVSDRIAALTSGRVDLVIAALTRTAARARHINFSAPYLTISQGALVRKELLYNAKGDREIMRAPLDDYHGLARLPGITIGVKRNTRPERLARKNFPGSHFKLFSNVDEAVSALVDGQVDAVVHDAPFLRAWTMLNASKTYKIKGLFGTATQEHLCIGMRKGDLEFLEFLNTFVIEAQADGTLSALRDSYLEDDEWTSLVKGGQR